MIDSILRIMGMMSARWSSMLLHMNMCDISNRSN
jgi:hypothetical protein